MRSIVFMLAGAVACISMFGNWFPVNLELGMLQIEELFGTVNPFTFHSLVTRIESELGGFAVFLPEGFEDLKTWGMALKVCAGVTVLLYVIGAAQIILRKLKFHNLVCCGAAAGAIINVMIFRNLIEDIYDVTGSLGASDYAVSVVMESPCGITLLCAILSVMGGEMICTWICQVTAQICMSIVNTIVRFCTFIKDWAEVIWNNAGYLAMDILGGLVACSVGAWIIEAVDSVLLAVIAGLLAGGLVAGIGCFGIWFAFMRGRAER